MYATVRECIASGWGRWPYRGSGRKYTRFTTTTTTTLTKSNVIALYCVAVDFGQAALGVRRHKTTRSVRTPQSLTHQNINRHSGARILELKHYFFVIRAFTAVPLCDVRVASTQHIFQVRFILLIHSARFCARRIRCTINNTTRLC